VGEEAHGREAARRRLQAVRPDRCAAHRARRRGRRWSVRRDQEAVGGLFVIQAASLDEATAIARECPVLRLQNGFVEVRAVERE
jgi:hypothetical protein